MGNDNTPTNDIADASERLMAEITADMLKLIARLTERVEQLEDIVRRTADRLGRAEGYLVEMDNRTDEIKSFLNGMCNSHD